MNENEILKIGFEESGIELEDYDMCQTCKAAVAVDRAGGTEDDVTVIMKWGSKYGV